MVRPDPLVIAARRIGTRVQVINLKRFQCSQHRCFPVVGGVLVHKDIDHLTQLFATTLGPYLLRAYNRLAAHWRTARAAAVAGRAAALLRRGLARRRAAVLEPGAEQSGHADAGRRAP